ncbi:MAG: pyridoxamine 5'-phosphate oxidase [Bacteroidetes bacterium]|nr:pyridoxamine 5'-phosphate oxidase [Bacteroidota bacterium]
MEEGNKKIEHRKPYDMYELTDDGAPDNPFQLFDSWINHAMMLDADEPHAMTLSTATGTQVSSRIVLLRSYGPEGFSFYTNYQSAKAKALEVNPIASLNFFWPKVQQQIRLEGKVNKLSASISEEYFASRPRESQVGAWASSQSEEISSRAALDEQFAAIEKKYENQTIPCPPHWGGYVLQPDYIEFWQGRLGRLHDRIAYKLVNNSWRKNRLCP